MNDILKAALKMLPFKGLKSYIIGFIMVIHGAFTLYYGETPTFDNPVVKDVSYGWDLIYNGLGLGALRAGISKTVVGFGGRAVSSTDTPTSVGIPLSR